MPDRGRDTDRERGWERERRVGACDSATTLTSRSGSRGGSFRSRARPCRATPPGNARSSSPCRGTSRLAGRAWPRPAPAGRGCRSAPAGCAPPRRRRSDGRCQRGTSRCTTPRRCPPCRRVRNRWREGAHRGGPRSRPRRCRSRGSGPGRCWPSSGRPAAARLPMRSAFRRARPVPRTRTRPRWAGACGPTCVVHRVLPRIGRPGTARARRGRCPGPRDVASGALDVAPPAEVGIERHRRAEAAEDDRAGHQVLRGRPRESPRASACARRW